MWHRKHYGAGLRVLKTFEVAENVLVLVRCSRGLGAGDFCGEHEHRNTDKSDIDSADDKAQPPGANPPRILSLNARIWILYNIFIIQ